MTAFQNTQIIFRCPQSLRETLIAVAEANDLKLSNLLRRLCRDFLSQHSPSTPPADLIARGGSQ